MEGLSASDSSGDDDDDDDDVQEVDDGNPDLPEFALQNCIFCPQKCQDLTACLMHMAKSHSFLVPHQDALIVDQETLLWYLHLVVSQYHECILCQSHRSTTEGLQQHMVAKGHCRMEISGEYADFYDLAKLTAGVADVGSRPIEQSWWRLASGKVLEQRSQTQNRPDARSGHSSSAMKSFGAMDTQINHATVNSGAIDKKSPNPTARKDPTSQLSIRDQRDLMHLTSAEQRSLLSKAKRQLSVAKRMERRDMAKLERRGNKTLRFRHLGGAPGLSHT